MWDSATGRQIAILRGHGGGVFTTAFTPEGAEVLNVRADAANVALPPEGRSAALTFRKRYEISGGGLNRVGEVVSELRWARSPSGWVITSERDLTVP